MLQQPSTSSGRVVTKTRSSHPSSSGTCRGLCRGHHSEHTPVSRWSISYTRSVSGVFDKLADSVCPPCCSFVWLFDHSLNSHAVMLFFDCIMCCFHSYGRYVEGTGSVLQCCTETEMESVFKGLDQCSEDEKLQRLSKLKLRYFTWHIKRNILRPSEYKSSPQLKHLLVRNGSWKGGSVFRNETKLHPKI